MLVNCAIEQADDVRGRRVLNDYLFVFSMVHVILLRYSTNVDSSVRTKLLNISGIYFPIHKSIKISGVSGAVHFNVHLQKQ